MSLTIRVNAEDLAKNIKWVSAGISKLDSVTHVRMEVDTDGTVELQCNSEANAYQGKMDGTLRDGDITKKRVFILDGEALMKAPRILVRDHADLVLKADGMDIVTPTSSFGVGISKTQMPASNGISEPVGSVLAEVLSKAAKQVAKAASGVLEKNLPALSCINLEFSASQGTLSLTATDRFSLAQKVIEYTPHNPNAEDFSILINSRLISQAASRIDNGAIINLFLENDGIRFGMSTDRQSVQLGIDKSEYPKYKSLMQANIESTVNVDRADFAKAVSNIRDMSSEDGVDITVEDASLSLSSGRTYITLDEDVESTGDNEITFNADKLQSALGFLTSHRIALCFPTSKKRGVVLRELLEDGDEDKSFFGLVIPMVKSGPAT